MVCFSPETRGGGKALGQRKTCLFGNIQHTIDESIAAAVGIWIWMSVLPSPST
jgi:hypothetical protein